MRLSKLITSALLAGFLSACAAQGQEDPDYRMFGKHARMREIAGKVIATGTNGWGGRYILLKDSSTGLRVYLQSDATTCTPGKIFRGTGHLTRAGGVDYDATAHLHLTDADKSCE